MITIRQGDSLEILKTLPDESVHCVVTSPPYWQLRNYQMDGQIGLEPTIDEFIAKLIELFKEIKRVLHRTGTIWINMGDSYNSSMSRSYFGRQPKYENYKHGLPRETIKKLHPKNLVGQPWRLAFALQEDGWILRSDIIWHKTNPMPSSIADRPTPSHEYLFLFSKSERYFYDHLAIREPTDASLINAPNGDRNKRTVWIIPTEPFPEAHFATYPTKLVEPCILAGTSEKGCCPKCLSPWIPIIEKVAQYVDGSRERKRANAPFAEVSSTSVFRTGQWNAYTRSGWQAGCKCIASDPIPCTVLDPFHGSGTTGLVASRLFRDYVGIELNPDYVEMSRRRIEADRPLFNKVEVVA